jgi:hypothetical protein
VSAQVLTIVTRLVAIDQFEGAGVVAEGAEGEGAAGGGVFGRIAFGGIIFGGEPCFSLGAHLVFQIGFFHAPDPHLTPAGHGHVFDEGDFHGGLRLKFVVQSGNEQVEAFFGFAPQNNGSGEHAMSQGIAGGGKFALGSDGTAGFGAVSTGSLFLVFSSHSITYCMWSGGSFMNSAGIC